jgi:alpha-beta hydrolase superfamily lysophospholipase
MGGAVALVAASRDDFPQADGLILAAPAVWVRSSMPFYQRWLLWLGAHTVPWFRVTGSSLHITASDNKEMLSKLRRDPLVIKETRLDALYGLSNLMDTAYSAAADLHLPALLLYGKKDEVIPEEPVKNAFINSHHGSAGRNRFIFYNNGYHMLLRDLQAKVVLEDIITWLTDHSGEFLSVQNGSAEEMYF